METIQIVKQTNMDGLLIFDQQNDIVFTKLNDSVKQKLFELAKEQELMGEDAVN